MLIILQVVVAEGAPRYGGHQHARKLAQAGINTTAIADSSIFAMMARVNKVVSHTLSPLWGFPLWGFRRLWGFSGHCWVTGHCGVSQDSVGFPTGVSRHCGGSQDTVGFSPLVSSVTCHDTLPGSLHIEFSIWKRCSVGSTMEAPWKASRHRLVGVSLLASILCDTQCL